MRLQNYQCVRIGLEFSTPFDKVAWGKMVASFASKKGTVKRKNNNPTAIQSVFGSLDKKADYHYHFRVDRLLKKGKKIFDFEISLHTNKVVRRKKKSQSDYLIANMEDWILGFLGKNLEGQLLNLNWHVSFLFRRPPFNSVFPMPFKSPFVIPRGTDNVGDISISGLKFKLENSKAGLETIYFEVFPKFISVVTLFNQKSELREGLIEQTLKNASTFAHVFVTKEKDHETQKI